MCTAVSLPTEQGLLFARTLDLDYHHEESVTLTPRRYPFSFSDGQSSADHPALLGTAYVLNGYPLYYDAINEHGLCMAGLAFRGYGAYAAQNHTHAHAIAPWELIPYVLSFCSSTDDVRQRLDGMVLTDRMFSDTLANQPMHWLIADQTDTLVLETDAYGRILLYDNPYRTLTNAPPFVQQCAHADAYQHLTPYPTKPIGETVHGKTTRGMGALGLPGDWTSPSRFVRAAYLARYLPITDAADAFALLDAVKVPRGAVLNDDGTPFSTIYSAVLQSSPMRCHMRTDAYRAARSVAPTALQTRGDTCISYPL